MNTKRIRGFTLWELLITMFVAGIVLGLGVPSLLEFTRNNTMATTANDLVGALIAARSEAVKRQVFLTLCASPNPLSANPSCSPTGAGTSGGYIVWVDENGNLDANGSPLLTDASDGDAVVDAGEPVLLRHRSIPDIQIFGDSGYVAFGPNGFRRDVPGLGTAANLLLFCDSRGNVAASGSLSAARVIRIDPTGRSHMLREVADIAAAIAPFGLACP